MCTLTQYVKYTMEAEYDLSQCKNGYKNVSVHK